MAEPLKTLETPVLIVGAGPVGIYMSLLLARYGIRSIVVDRGERGGDHGLGIRPHPRAHVLNTRTMELLREIGLDR
jgi:2-polyprenyl-6-methoxyphenol hydroxylase-like FAD-dependent oxidoreductase